MNVIAEADVRRLTGDELKAFGDAQVYEVVDETTQEGVFFLIVDPEEQKLTLTSIDMDGNPSVSDLMIIGSRVTQKPSDESDEDVTWTGNLEKNLNELLGNHAAIILQDLKKTTEGKNLPLTSSEDERDAVRGMKFDFDPSINADDQTSGGDDGGSGGGDTSEPGLPELPPSIDPEGDGEVDVDGITSPDSSGTAEPDSEDDDNDSNAPDKNTQ